MRELRWIPILVTLALIGSPGSACAGPFSLDVDILGSLPLGSVSDGRRLDEHVSAGYGVRADVLYRVTPVFSAGLGVAAESHDAHVFAGYQRVAATLTAIPVCAVARLHGTQTRGLRPYVETGVGITAWDLDPAGMLLETRTQTTPCFLAGAGVSYVLSRRWDARAGIQFQGSLTGRGEVWASDDDPRFLVLSLGARFQR